MRQFVTRNARIIDARDETSADSVIRAIAKNPARRNLDAPRAAAPVDLIDWKHSPDPVRPPHELPRRFRVLLTRETAWSRWNPIIRPQQLRPARRPLRCVAIATAVAAAMASPPAP
jgi:hypothetical protein